MRMPSTFAKLATGYMLFDLATYLSYLVTGERPSLSDAYVERPIFFWAYVAGILLAAIYGERAHRKIARFHRSSLKDSPGSDRLAVFFPAVRVFSDPIGYVNRHPRYLNPLSYMLIATALLVLVRVIFLPQTVPMGGGRALELTAMLTFPVFCLIVLFEEYHRGYLFQVKFLRRAHSKQKEAERAILDAELLRAKNKEQEDVMALVAHKFRGSLDRIIYNIDHENSPRVYREAVSTMRGLLDIFSLISTDTVLLRRKLLADCEGSATVADVATRSLGLALGQLLALRGAERIQQHFFAYAKRNRLVPPETRLRDWYEDHADLAEQLRREWEVSLMECLPDADLPALSRWTGERFCPLAVEGYSECRVRFAPFGTTESLLTILFTEAFTNMLKYYASASNAACSTAWRMGEDLVSVGFDNPTTANAASMVKGSGRGHDFLRLLTQKLGGDARTDRTEHAFRLTLTLPANLFWEPSP
jgi:hypothetical protein